MLCVLCEKRRPDHVVAANAECSNCGGYVCYEHAVRVQQGEFLCLDCYEGNEEFYKEHRRLIQKPRYSIPRPPGERVNTSYENDEGRPSATPPSRSSRKNWLQRLLRR